jgi:hypothetical protein
MPVDPAMQAALDVALWIIYVQALVIQKLLTER